MHQTPPTRLAACLQAALWPYSFHWRFRHALPQNATRRQPLHFWMATPGVPAATPQQAQQARGSSGSLLLLLLLPLPPLLPLLLLPLLALLARSPNIRWGEPPPRLTLDQFTGMPCIAKQARVECRQG